MMRPSAPVSYTHLDVYKRQVQLSVGIMPHDAGVEAPAVVFGLGDDFYGFGPVSYTHLILFIVQGEMEYTESLAEE